MPSWLCSATMATARSGCTPALNIPSTPRVLTGSRPKSSSAWVKHSNRSEEHTSELQSLMRISYAVFCLKKKTKKKEKRVKNITTNTQHKTIIKQKRTTQH